MSRYQILLLLLSLPSIWADICDHCECDVAHRSVTCSKKSLLIRTVSLFPYVERLYLKGLNLPRIPHILFHTGLRHLRINNCGLLEIDAHTFIPVPNLETLDLSDNQLEGLPATIFRGLKSLKVLNLMRNQLSNLSFLNYISTEGIQLERLDLSGNPIKSSVPTTVMPSVRQLFLADTNVEKMTGSTLIFKSSTSCPVDESCRSLNLTHLTSMNTFSLANNYDLVLEETCLSFLYNVSYLNLAGSKLPSSFPNWLQEQSHVVNLNVSFCSLDLEDGHWKWCGSFIETMDISGMKLKKLSIEHDCSLRDLRAFSNLISVCKLEGHALETIDLKGNVVSDWPLLSEPLRLEHLRSLSLSKNLLTSLPPNAMVGYPLLQHLDLSGNLISEIDHSAFPSVGMELHSLDLSENQLTALPHPVLPSLKYLDVSRNDLVTFDRLLFAGIPQLQHFRASDNPSIFIRCGTTCWVDEMDQLTELLTLDLSNTNLGRNLPLSHLSSLHSLFLRNNQLYSIDASELPARLRILDVGENRIHFMSNFSRLTFLNDLRADSNPLRCDCSLHDVVSHLFNQSQISDPSIYYCYSGSWQYPLLPYLVTVKPCRYHDHSFAPILIGTFAMAMIVICTFLLTIVLYKRYVVRCSRVYSRLSTADIPVRL